MKSEQYLEFEEIIALRKAGKYQEANRAIADIADIIPLGDDALEFDPTDPASCEAHVDGLLYECGECMHRRELDDAHQYARTAHEIADHTWGEGHAITQRCIRCVDLVLSDWDGSED